jgi:hypothetical protein
MKMDDGLSTIDLLDFDNNNNRCGNREDATSAPIKEEEEEEKDKAAEVSSRLRNPGRSIIIMTTTETKKA